MAQNQKHGGGVMLLAGVIAAAAAYYDYNTVSTGLDGSGGAQLVLASSVLMVFGALMVMLLSGGALAGIFLFLLLLDVIGTAVAGYFLESGLIMAAMALAALGWIWRATSGRRTA